MTYGYCRISRKEQSIDRQIRNITAIYPNAVLVQEAYTGTKLEGREELLRLLRRVRAGDTIVFDSVSRMSRNAADGIELYDRLLGAGVDLVFLNERHIDTTTYKTALAQAVGMTGNNVVDAILAGVNEALRILRHQQIEQAFAQAQKEVDDLHERTRQGMETARLCGKQIGRPSGQPHHDTRKATEAKAVIRKHSRSFGGTLTDDECRNLAGVAVNTFYKYKREIALELA